MFSSGKKQDRAKLDKWQKRFEEAKEDASGDIARMQRRKQLYNGDKHIVGPTGAESAKQASSVRNIVFELIESQVDSNIPTPKVMARDAQNEELAQEIEDMLRNEVDRLPFERLNDEDERVTPMQGGDYFLVEWDSAERTHTTVGELTVRLIHPRQVLVQKGITDFRQADWVFIMLAQTKDYIQKRYGVDVTDEGEEYPEMRGDGQSPSEDMVTQVICYYRNKDSGIGRFSWCNDVVLEDMEDYQARRLTYCKMCDAKVPEGIDECPYCGSKKLESRNEDYETLDEDIVLYDEQGQAYKRIPAMSPVLDEMGQPMTQVQLVGFDQLTGTPQYGEMPVMEPTKIPFYKPSVMPLVLRKNVSVNGQLLGNSDVDAVEDQQNNIKKYNTKIDEKLQKGGSIVILPRDLQIEATDEEMKIVRVKDPAQKAMIDVTPLQGDISRDMELLENNYQWARQTIGITDSFQGRKDSTATSGKAKEFAASQSAGRLESKRVMKQAAYADIFEVMFKLMLAYADEPRSYRAKDKLGNEMYRVFNRYDFLEQDEAGEWYWNDRYLFSTDSSGTLAQNREAMWQETRMNLQQGAFGDPNNPDTLIMFWTLMEGLHYPLAGVIKANLEEQKAQQEQMMQAQQQAMMQQQMALGGVGQQAMMQITAAGGQMM